MKYLTVIIAFLMLGSTGWSLGKIGSTLGALKGDISSSGDAGLKEEPDFVEIILKKFEKNTLFHCQLIGKPYVFEFTKSFDHWSNRGAVRVVTPGAAGGAEVVYLESYEKFTEIDPTTTKTTLRFASRSEIKNNLPQDYLNLEIILEPISDRLEFVDRQFMFSLNGKFQSGHDLNCHWGPAKLNWD